MLILRRRLLVLVAVGLCVPALSQSPAGILNIVKQQDRLASNASFAMAFKSQASGISSHMSYEASYSPTAFVAAITVPDEHGQPLTEKRWEEQGCAISQVGKDVVIENPRPGGLGFARRTPEGAPQGIGPQFCWGRGLSLCRDPKIVATGATVTFTGTFDGKKVLAELDPAHKYLATEISYLSPRDGSRFLTWFNHGPTTDSNGFVYANSCELLGRDLRQEFATTRLQSGKQNVDAPHWFQSGCSFSDERVSPSVGYKSVASLLKASGGKEPSLAQLYQTSLAKSREFAASKAQDALMQRVIAERTAKERAARVLTVAATFLGALGLLVFGKRLLKGKIEG